MSPKKLQCTCISLLVRPEICHFTRVNLKGQDKERGSRYTWKTIRKRAFEKLECRNCFEDDGWLLGSGQLRFESFEDQPSDWRIQVLNIIACEHHDLQDNRHARLQTNVEKLACVISKLL